jgi:hypothetical protein
MDEALADEVWALWDQGLISDDAAAGAWWSMVAVQATVFLQSGHS